MVQAATSYTIGLIPKMTSAKDFYGLVEQGCLDNAAMMDDVTCFYSYWNKTSNRRRISEDS
jgi:hypothetical protein